MKKENCSHENSTSVKINKTLKLVSCRECGADVLREIKDSNAED